MQSEHHTGGSLVDAVTIFAVGAVRVLAIQRWVKPLTPAAVLVITEQAPKTVEQG